MKKYKKHIKKLEKNIIKNFAEIYNMNRRNEILSLFLESKQKIQYLKNILFYANNRQ